MLERRVTVAMVSQVPAMGAKGSVPDMMCTNERRSMEEKIYVAVGRDVESKSTLIWALQNTGGREFCIFHVHQMLQISTSSTKFWGEHQRNVHRKERDKAQKVLDKYLRISRQMGVKAETLYIEMDTIENGILQLISQQRVKKLVMGAASDRNYSMRMRDVESRKAIFVRQQAPGSCRIWFTCKGYLICTREPVRENFYIEYVPSHQPDGTQSTSSGQDSVRRGRSDLPLRQFEITPGTEGVPSLPDQKIRVALAEAEKSKQEAVMEVDRRLKAEKDATDAITRAKQWERSYLEVLKRKTEAETELAKAKVELEKTRALSDSRIVESDRTASRLQHEYNLAVRLLQRFIKERDELQAGCDRAIRELDELKRNRAEPSAPPLPVLSSEHREAPQCFFCPILKEIMEDPQVAADGFTYEAKAIRKWLESGHETSPMINKKLPHTGLVPNHALRSAIQEWLQFGKPSRLAS